MILDTLMHFEILAYGQLIDKGKDIIYLLEFGKW